jgi:hypothetical protein
MYRGSGPRILPIIIIILVVALVIAAVVSIGRMMFTNSSTSSPAGVETTESVLSALHETGDSRSVRWTVRGPIVADEQFKTYTITVGPTARSFVTRSGYEEQVIDTKTYRNNTSAYEQFVYALEKAGIANTRSAGDIDFRGVCATHGLAFRYESLQNGTAEHSLWTTTCGGSKGTMTANIGQIQALFVNQIPDFKPQFDSIY